MIPHGEVNQILVTTTKDPNTKEDLVRLRIGKYVEVHLTMDQAGVAAAALDRVRQLYYDKHGRKVEALSRTRGCRG